jgi:hypothetical protein
MKLRLHLLGPEPLRRMFRHHLFVLGLLPGRPSPARRNDGPCLLKWRFPPRQCHQVKSSRSQPQSSRTKPRTLPLHPHRTGLRHKSRLSFRRPHVGPCLRRVGHRSSILPSDSRPQAGRLPDRTRCRRRRRLGLAQGSSPGRASLKPDPGSTSCRRRRETQARGSQERRRGCLIRAKRHITA